MSAKSWEDSNSVLMRYVVPAANEMGANLIEIAAPEIGKVFTEKKKFISVAMDVATENLRKQLGAAKT